MLLLMAILPSAAWAQERQPNDPLYGEQWYLHKIAAAQAWGTTLGFEGVTVAVIDSGVDIDHPDLKENIWTNRNEIPGNGIDDDLNGYVDDVHGWDFVDNDNDPRPSLVKPYSVIGASHGTVTASLIAARGDNGRGLTGVTWQTTVMPMRVLDSSGEGNSMSVVRAVEYAVKNGAKVINLGFVGDVGGDLLRIALRRAYDAGVTVVAAAGNAPEGGVATDLDATPLYPVCFDANATDDFVIGVAATDEFDTLTDFSNYGAKCVDVSAPGSRILAAKPYRPENPDFNKLYGGYYSGTSVATPLVSGAAALLLSMNPRLTPAQILALLGSTAAKVTAPRTGAAGRGRLDVGAAVRALEEQLASRAPMQSAAPAAVPGGKMIAVAAGPGRAPDIRLFTAEGLFIREFAAFPKEFRGGISLSAGDLDGSGSYQLAAGAGPGGLPQVRIFDRNGSESGTFLAFDSGFRGGVSVAVGDVQGKGRAAIVAAAGPGGGPHVRIFDARGVPIGGGFFAFDKGFRGGLSVGVGDLNGDGKAEIAAVSGAGMPVTVRTFDLRGNLLGSFQPFGSRERRGARISVQDIDGDGTAELLVTLGVKNAKPVAFTSAGRRLGEFDGAKALFADSRKWSSGTPDALTWTAAGSPPAVTVFSSSAAPLQFQAFEKKFAGGVTAAVLK